MAISSSTRTILGTRQKYPWRVTAKQNVFMAPDDSKAVFITSFLVSTSQYPGHCTVIIKWTTQYIGISDPAISCRVTEEDDRGRYTHALLVPVEPLLPVLSNIVAAHQLLLVIARHDECKFVSLQDSITIEIRQSL